MEKEEAWEDHPWILKPKDGIQCPDTRCRDTSIEDKIQCNQYECPYHDVEEFMCEW